MASVSGSTVFSVIYILIYSNDLLDVTTSFNVLFYIIRSNKMRLYGKSTKDLPSEKFYDAMDMDSPDLQKYDRTCNDIKVKNHREQMIPICKKYLRFLDTSKEWIELFSAYDVSLLINYWIYEKLIRIYGDKESNDFIMGFSDLQMMWGYFDYGRKRETYYKKCWPDPSKFIHDDWEKRKELYNYYVDSNYLFMMANVNDDKCKYYKIIEGKKSLYEHFESECLPPKKNCPNFYDQCKPHNPKYVLPNLHCYAEMQKAASETLLQSPDTGNDLAQKQQLEPGDDNPQFERAAASTQDAQSISQSYDIRTKVANSVLGTAPVLFTATMLYRVYTHSINIYHYSINL
ncbi:hypothetical protein PVNG_04488 [Plasmodium vivax North Korean]|uniref:Uncharacterized protein n=1 Tax=Plasmodium vivax North Korean TaxID=1035514 RepID=A0A0J9U2I2_PLAVI|nr:hypothetical protein PVNG_04488 [Plasmodium vivax North Korean]